MSVSRAGKAPQVLVVGRLIDAFDEEIASVAAATVRSYLPGNENQTSPGRVRRPRPAG